jgi:hypothetical protein
MLAVKSKRGFSSETILRQLCPERLASLIQVVESILIIFM